MSFVSTGSIVLVASSLMVAESNAQTNARPVPAPEAKTAVASRLFQAGSAAFSAGDLKAAHLDFAKLVRLVPSVSAAHAAFGAVLLAEGNAQEAVAELVEARRLDPNDARTAINLGMAWNELGDTRKAADSFEVASRNANVTFSSQEAIAYAGSLIELKQLPQAEQVLRSAISQNPQNVELADALGSVLAQQQRYELAAAAFTNAIKLDKNYGKAHAHLGSVFLAIGRAQDAVEELQAAVRAGDTSTVTRVELGRALNATGQDQAAVDVLKAALAAAPASTDAKYALALALQSSGDSKSAVPLFEEVRAVRPDDAGVLTNSGLLHVQIGDAKGALRLYERALKVGGSSATLHEDMGAAYLQANDIDHALEQFQAGLALEPNNVQLRYDLGLAYKLKDNLPAAITELTRAEELDPQLPDPPYTLGVIEMQRGEFAEARKQLERAVALQPANAEAWSLLGTVYKEAGDGTKAADALRHAMSLAPEKPSPHVMLAAILAESGDKAGAAAERKTAADLTRTAVGKQRLQFALDSGKTLLARGQLAEAIVQFESAVQAAPDSAEAHLGLATALTRAGRQSDAIAEQQKADALGKHPASAIR